jgi:hypothetical protein
MTTGCSYGTPGVRGTGWARSALGREPTEHGPGGCGRRDRPSAFLITALVLLRLSVPAHPGPRTVDTTNSGRRTAVVIALNLVPLAGIAFFWFIGVIRQISRALGDHRLRQSLVPFIHSGRCRAEGSSNMVASREEGMSQRQSPILCEQG